MITYQTMNLKLNREDQLGVCSYNPQYCMEHPDRTSSHDIGDNGKNQLMLTIFDNERSHRGIDLANLKAVLLEMNRDC